jgi:hypothetical protein
VQWLSNESVFSAVQESVDSAHRPHIFISSSFWWLRLRAELSSGDDTIPIAMDKPTSHSLATKITALWTVFLLGTLFHTQLALMPLFHGLSVVESHAHDYISVNAVMWFMLIFFSLPLLAIVGCVFSPSPSFRKLHFGMTLVYTVLNLLHLGLDSIIAVPSYQLVLMTFLMVVGLLLNIVAYQWMKTANRAAKQLHPST